MDFSMNFLWFWMCFINVLFEKLLLLLQTLFYQKCIIGWCLACQRLDPMNLKMCSLGRHPRLWLDSWQSLETFAKIISVTSISILYSYILFVTRALVSQNGGGDGRAQERVFNLLPQEQPPHLHPYNLQYKLHVSFVDICALTQKANPLNGGRNPEKKESIRATPTLNADEAILSL